MSKFQALPSLSKAATANGFGVLCIRNADGERFTIVQMNAAGLAALGARGIRLGGPLTEAELREQLEAAGFPDDKIDAGILIARQWATTITVRTH